LDITDLLGGKPRMFDRNTWLNATKFKVAGAALALCALTGPAAAEELFGLQGTVTGVTGASQRASVSFTSIEDLANKLDNSGLRSIFSSYTNVSAASAVLNIRGLPATATYALNSSTLRFQVPSAGIDLTFNGATRDQSQDQFLDFLKGNGSDILSKMLKKLVAESPIDPIAGNPSSLQSKMGEQTFGNATGFGTLSEPFGSRDGKGGFQAVPGLVSVGGDVGFARSGGYNSTIATLPIKYSYYFSDPRYAITVDLPITYVRTEGANSGQASLGLSFRFPVVDNWFLVPSARLGAAGSLDLGAGALMYSGDLTSVYNIYAGDLKVTVGNGVGIYRSQKLSVGDISLDYDLQNTALKNGVSVEGPLGFTMFDSPTSWQVYVTDTHMFGDKLYVQHYDEVGVLFGTRPTMDGQSWNSFRLGLSYTHGSDYNAVKANFGYRF